MVSFFRGAGPTVLAFFWPGIDVLIGLIAMGLVAAYGSPNWLTKIIVGITLTQFDSLGSSSLLHRCPDRFLFEVCGLPILRNRGWIWSNHRLCRSGLSGVLRRARCRALSLGWRLPEFRRWMRSSTMLPRMILAKASSAGHR